jgi:hypothetical protein
MPSPDNTAGTNQKTDLRRPNHDAPPPDQPPVDRRPKPESATTSSASGTLTAEQVDDVVSKSGDLFARCSRIEAVINVHATVDTDGHVLAASATRSAPDDARMRDCVTQMFRSLSFPPVDAASPTRCAFDLRVTPRS